MRAALTRHKYLFWPLGGAALALLVFIRITRELLEGDVDRWDRAILHAVDARRLPLLTIAAMDVTALGSVTLLTFLTIIALSVLLVLRDRLGCLQLVAASIGSALLTEGTKDLIERIRPPEAQHLVVVLGLFLPERTFGFDLRALPAHRHHCRASRPGSRGPRFAVYDGCPVSSDGRRVPHLPGSSLRQRCRQRLSLGAAWSLILAAGFAHYRR